MFVFVTKEFVKCVNSISDVEKLSNQYPNSVFKRVRDDAEVNRVSRELQRSLDVIKSYDKEATWGVGTLYAIPTYDYDAHILTLKIRTSKIGILCVNAPANVEQSWNETSITLTCKEVYIQKFTPKIYYSIAKMLRDLFTIFPIVLEMHDRDCYYAMFAESSQLRSALAAENIMLVYKDIKETSTQEETSTTVEDNTNHVADENLLTGALRAGGVL